MAQDQLVRLCLFLSLPEKSVAVPILPSRKSPACCALLAVPSLAEAVCLLQGWMAEAGPVWFARRDWLTSHRS